MQQQVQAHIAVVPDIEARGVGARDAVVRRVGAHIAALAAAAQGSLEGLGAFAVQAGHEAADAAASAARVAVAAEYALALAAVPVGRAPPQVKETDKPLDGVVDFGLSWWSSKFIHTFRH